MGKNVNMEQENVRTVLEQTDAQENVEAKFDYQRVASADIEENQLPVDFRRVQHGHGPCACCGPYTE